jgi:hypothetical protein
MAVPIGDGLTGRERSRRRRGTARILAAAAAFALLAAAPALGQSKVEVIAQAEDTNVLLGESVFFQVKILGGTNVGQPDVSKLTDFEVRELPIAWVQDRLGPRLKKFKLDEGTVPPIPVDVDGHTYQTAPVRIRVEVPPPSDEYMLSLTLGKRRVYVGEQVTLTAVWYFQETASFFSARIPIMRSDSFESIGDAANSLPSRPVFGAQSWPGKQSTILRDGMVYHTVTFVQVLLAKQPGDYEFPPGTVQVWIPPEGQAGQQPDWRTRWNYRTVVVGSQPLSIHVLPLPVQGRPANFSGLVSDGLAVSASLTPDTMNVGDPVTLTIGVSGPPSIEKAEIPAVDTLADLGQDFLLRSAPLKSDVQNGTKSFHQTVRVKNEGVREVPAFAVPYFDTRTGSYRLARSRPVPITVRPTRIVTAQDLQGAGPVPGPGAAGPAVVRALEGGILFNYAGTGELLVSQPVGVMSYAARPAVPSIIGASLLVLAAGILVSRRRAAAARRAAQPAPDAQDFTLESLAGGGTPAAPAPFPAGDALEALRVSIAAKLQLSPGRMTWRDMEDELPRHGVGEDLLHELSMLFGCHEEGSYGASQKRCAEDDSDLRARVARAASQLAREYR